MGFAVFLFAGNFGARSRTTEVAGSLAIRVGFALTLAAFGSRAGGQWRGWSVLGAGALAIILFLLIMHYVEPGLSKTGRIEADLKKVAVLTIVDDHPLYEYMDRSTKSFQFVVLQDKFMNHCVEAMVDTTEKGDGREFFELRGNGDDISEKYIRKEFQTPILWRLNYEKRVITDGNYGHIVFYEPDTEDIIACATAKSAKVQHSFIPSIFINRAAAQSIDVNNAVDGDALVQQLKSDEPRSERFRFASVASGRRPPNASAKLIFCEPADSRQQAAPVVVEQRPLRPL